MVHHADIQAILDRFGETAPLAAARASTALALLLHQSYLAEKRSPVDRQMAWRFSTLTGDGFPLEWVFTSADSQLRYVVDPGGPDLLPAQRLANAAGLVAQLAQPVNSEWLEELLAWHRAAAFGELRYGAWIAGRHHNVRSADQFKLYVETPVSSAQAAQALVSSYCNEIPHVPARKLQLRMLGLELTTGRIEFYYRVNDLQSAALSHLLYPAGLRARADELLYFVEEAYGYSLRAADVRIPGGSVGFSYSISPDSGQVAFTLFLYVRLLWGGDAHIRKRFSEQLAKAGVDPSPYWQVTTLLSGRDIHQTYHSSVGFVLASDGPIQISLGVRPPPVQNQLDLLSSQVT
ncbi:MAG: hypothetical protein ACM3PS_09075 [Syntrophothermus sp.]|jgi:hypothetical protein